MKIREKLLIGLLVVTAVYAALLKENANRLRTDLATLQASNARLKENHLQMKGKFIELTLNLGTKDDAVRKLLAVLEADQGAEDMSIPSAPNTTTRVNKAPSEPTK